MKSKLAILGLASVALVAGGCNKATNTNTTTSNTNTQAATNSNANSAPAVMTKTAEVTMAAQNGSKQTGTVTFTSTADNKTKVSVNIASGAAGVAQPSHIHIGTCAAPGAVKFPLTNVVNGKAETTVDVSFMDMWNQLPLAINVHKSAAEAGVYVACGELPAMN